MFSKDVEITAPNGLHTRPAAEGEDEQQAVEHLVALIPTLE